MDINERIKIDKLSKIYGEFLTERQRETLSMYVDNNLSLSEVSEELKVTRQAVKDALDKSVETLNFLEEKLKILDKKERILKILDSFNSDSIKEKIIEILEE